MKNIATSILILKFEQYFIKIEYFFYISIIIGGYAIRPEDEPEKMRV